MPRIVCCVIGPQNGARMGPRLDLPERAVLGHRRHDDELAVFLDVFFSELLVGVDRIGVVIREEPLRTSSSYAS